MKRKLAVGLGILLAVVLLLPVPLHLKDGGTVEYRAALYSVKKVHRLNPVQESGQAFLVGTVVEILGVKVFDDVA